MWKFVFLSEYFERFYVLFFGIKFMNISEVIVVIEFVNY